MGLSVRIISPKEELFNGEVESLSSANSAGVFDILPGHTKFVTIIEKKPIILRLKDQTQKKYEFDLAIIHVRTDKVDIYINP